MKPVIEQIDDLERRVAHLERLLRRMALGLPVCKLSLEGLCPLACVDESCVALEKVKVIKHE